MRKVLAVTMIAILSVMFALAVVGCSSKQSTETSTTPPPAETSAPMDSSMMMDSTHHDSTMVK